MRLVSVPIAAALLIFCVTPTWAAGPAIQTGAAPGGLRLTIDLPEADWGTASAGARVWDTLSIPGAGRTSEIGRPDLPLVHRLLALPPGADGADIRVVDIERSTHTNVAVSPWQKPKNRNGGGVSPFALDADVYDADTWWPASPIRVGAVASIGGARVLPVTIYAARYNGAQNRVEIARRVVLDITWTHSATSAPGLMTTPRVSRAMDRILRRIAVIPAPMIDAEESEAWLPEDGTYLIVCEDSLCDAATPLAEWKARKGFAVEIVPTSAIAETPTADDIKTYLADHYASDERGLDYVLLVGDIDQIPTFYGLWGTLADHDFTTVDGDDYFADFIIGRLSGETPDEITVQVNKSLNYERSPVTTDDAWFTSALTISGSDYYDDENAGYCADQAEGYGFGVADRYFQSNGKNTNENVTASLGAGRSWISYFGHGWEEAWSSVAPQFSNDDALSLENGGMLPVISSIACSNGAFDYGGDCFAEAWMKAGEDKGAAAVFAAARLTPFFYTDSLGKAMARGYFTEGMDTFGAAAFFGKMGMYEEYPEAAGGETEEVMQHFHIFGDPDLPVWSATPIAFDEPVAAWDTEAKTLTIAISSGRGADVGALVHVFGDGADFLGRTDDAGTIVFSYDVEPTANWEIVVTARNHVPFEGDIEPASEPADDDVVDDDTTDDDIADDDDAAGDDDDVADLGPENSDSEGASRDNEGACGC